MIYMFIFRHKWGDDLQSGYFSTFIHIIPLKKNLLDSLLGTLPSLGMLNMGLDSTLGFEITVVML